MSSRPRISLDSDRIRFLSSTPSHAPIRPPRVCSRLRNRFSTTSSGSITARVWWTVSMPSDRATSGDGTARSTPLTLITPESGA